MRSVSPPVVVALALLAAACSPTQTFGTVEGLRCSNQGDEVCSQEAGFPRARCDFDGTWHILEHCGASTCIVENAPGGQHRTRCGGSQPTGGGAIQVDAKAGPPPTGDATTVAEVDSKAEPKADSTGTPAVACGSYSCVGVDMCTFFGTCESKSCPTACTHGARCSLGVCLPHCYGTCASTEYCKFGTDAKSADMCSKLGCQVPLDLGTAVAAIGMQLPATATTACAHLKGAAVAFNHALASVPVAAADLEGTLTSGGETLAFADLAGLAQVALLGTTALGTPCGSPCLVQLSKAENLHPAMVGVPGPCALRWTAKGPGRFDKLPLPLRLGAVRVPLLLRDVEVVIASDLKTAEVCGHVGSAEVAAALSGLPTASGPGFQIKTALQQGAGKPDVDSDGDGKADAWSVALTLATTAAQLTKWSP
ncbi:MAG: hypothetical protein FJ100_16485 [Deltaproteobacteria bacterium]|nr:hypothetical protein [Deltaproteobacteria bacterium]